MICYLAEAYPSMRRVATDYARMVGALTDRVEDAKAVIFHGSLGVLPAMVRQYKKTQPWIGYLVWEAEELPDAAIAMLPRLDEVWTASSYCAGLFRPYHPNVHVIGHVAEPPPYNAQDRAIVQRRVERIAGETLVLAVANWNDPRKNLAQLLRCYARVQVPGMRLVVKSISVEPIGRTNAVWWDEGVEASTLSALIDHCDAMISVHHGEGWGLNLSDAMAYGKVVCATGYSGNMEFMRESNALLLPYTLGPVGEAARPFQPHMTWARLEDSAIEEGLLRIVTSVQEQRLGARARQDMREFSREAIRAHVRQRLSVVAG